MAIILWKPKNLEYAVKTANYMEHARLNGTVEKSKKKPSVVDYVISLLIV